MESLYAALDLRREPPFWPPFAAMLVLEVWNSSSGPLVRWISNGNVVLEATPWSVYKESLVSLKHTGEACESKPEEALVLGLAASMFKHERIPEFLRALSDGQAFSLLSVVVLVAMLIGLRLLRRRQ